MTRAWESSPAVVAIAASVLVFLTWQGWLAGRNGLSEIYARPAISYLEEKGAADFQISEAEWQAIYNSILRADELMPDNPQYLDSLGWLHQIKLGLLADALDIDQVAAHARAAEDYYRRAVAVRPTWPYYWGGVALEEYRGGNYGTENYSLALANAARFGPWKNDTQQLVADLGSDTLELLSPGAQRAFLLNLERGLRRQPDAMFAIVRDWTYICATAKMSSISLPLLLSHCERHTVV